MVILRIAGSRCIVVVDGQFDSIRRLLVEQGDAKHLVHVFHEMEGQSFEILLGYVVDVLAVVFADDDFRDAGAFGCEDFLLDAAHGQHAPAQGDFARHGDTRLHLTLRQRAGNGGGNGDAGRRTVFRRCALGHMHVQPPVVEHAVVDAEAGGVRPDVFEGEHGRFLHHVAEVAREGELRRLAAAHAGLDEENFAAHGRPCQARHNAGVVVALIFVAAIDRFAQ